MLQKPLLTQILTKREKFSSLIIYDTVEYPAHMVLGSLVDSSTLLIKTERFPFQLQTIEMDIAVIRERKPKTILVDSINNILYFHGIDFLADLFSLGKHN